MRRRDLFQTVENKELEKLSQLGPIKCNDKDAWLGCGFYFWDSYINDAYWWGNKHYHGDFAVFKSGYDYDSYEYLDLMGNTEHRDYIFNCHNALYKKCGSKLRMGQLIEILKKADDNFIFKAVRAIPDTTTTNTSKIYFEQKKSFFQQQKQKIQLCVFDKSFLINNQFELVYQVNYQV